MDTIDNGPELAEILHDLTYPAEKWRIIACAEIYGVDMTTRRALYALPARAYENADDVRAALAESSAAV